ncbi:E2/UBC family protein [Aeromicrobium sp.]|uniref:E2/UBC family protein n=1 Tax=Aeromicrobium sp. TaxID=1871063 RepID=UPI0030BCFBE6
MTELASVLREQDEAFLADAGLTYTIDAEPGFANLVVEKFSTAPGLAPDNVNLLLRLPFGFPDAAPDMFWVDPQVTSGTGAAIPGTELIEIYVNRSWQRWSRHIAQQWRPGIDNLETYLGYVRRCLRQAGDS